MTSTVSTLYLSSFPATTRGAAQLKGALGRGMERAAARPVIFFRADDIGVPSKNFRDMVNLFQQYRYPLCLATVPSWLSRKNLSGLLEILDTSRNQMSEQWYFHQHGRLHRNFESGGKKMEFGDSRSADAIRHNLLCGKLRLEELLKTAFNPVFTPPWNRCGQTTLDNLTKLGFRALSRSLGATPKAPPDLPDFQINIDLHTRKEADPDTAWTGLLEELEKGLGSGMAGIMLHHQRMNDRAFELLDILLGSLQELPVDFVHFGDLLDIR